jgi:surface protein
VITLLTLVCGGLGFLFFVAPSHAVFEYARTFNQDVSNWNTGAVTDMAASKCILSLPLCRHAFSVVMYLNTTTRLSSDHNSHTFCYFVLFLERYFLLFVVGWYFFSLWGTLSSCSV